jgi:aspartyl/asparaginyl beta-hydroxylase (cupin superfamily)
MNHSELVSAINEAFNKNFNERGLELLRKLNNGSHSTAESHHRQAVIEEQIGDWENAGNAHRRCIESAPHVATAYLYAGYWFLKSKKNVAAASLFSLANEAKPTIFTADSIASAEPNTAERLRAGSTHLRSHLSDHHRQYLFDIDSSDRIKQSVWLQSHDRPVSNLSENYAPQLFYIPELEQTEFYDIERFAWADKLQLRANDIREELMLALNNHQKTLSVRPYLEQQFNGEPGLQELAGSLNWSAIDLYRDGALNQTSAPLFPVTLAAMSDIPTYQLESTPYEVFFSVLKPKQKIAPHYGQSNHSLTVHLALDIPDDCYLQVGAQQRCWKNNEIIVFDDNFPHAAYNNSNRQRIVLIFSIWHPDLDKSEQTALRQAYSQRQNWMAERTKHIAKLPSKNVTT